MKLGKSEQELLKLAFQPPESKKKRVFLRTMPKQELTLGRLLFSQAAFIRKWVWAMSFLLFGAGVLLADCVSLDAVWVISALAPFTALLLLLEFARSSAYGMAELELSARFSLRTILLARMAMLGMAQLAGLFLAVGLERLVVFLGLVIRTEGSERTFFQSGIYLLVPYLLTAVLGLLVLRQIHGKEGMAACGAVSAMVSVLAPLSRLFLPELYEKSMTAVWLVAALFLAEGLVKEYKKTIHYMEELA